MHTELLDSVALLPLPSERTAIGHGVAASHAGRLLQALEPTGSALEDLVTALCALQDLVQSQHPRIHSIDVNPLLLTGERLVAVDALVVLPPPAQPATIPTP